MPKRDMRARPLAYVLIRRLLLGYLVFAALVISVQLIIEYRDTRTEMLTVVESLADTSAPGAEVAIWEYQELQLSSLAKGIGAHPAVAAVEIFDSQRKLDVSWRSPSARSTTAVPFVERRLHRHTAKGQEEIGTLRIFASEEYLARNVRIALLKVAGGTLALLLLSGALAVILVRSLIVKPLEKFSARVDRFRSQNGADPIDLGMIGSAELQTLQSGFNRLMEDVRHSQQRATDELRATEQRLRGLYETATFGIALLDTQGRYLDINKAFERISGYTRDELNRLNDWALVSKGYSTIESGPLEPLKARERYGPDERECVRKDGQTISLRINGVLIHGVDAHDYIWAIVEDISERKIAEEERQRSDRLLRSAIDTIGEAFVVFDEHDRLLTWNRKYKETYPVSGRIMEPGRTFEELLRYDVAHGQIAQAFGREEAWIAERMEQHRRGGTDVMQKLSNGHWLRVLERKTPLGHTVGFRFDVTELVEAKEAAEAANIAKTDFIANMSHELRTPMNAILGMLHLASNEHLTPSARSYLAKAQSAAHLLLRLINDILDLSKIEAGRLEIESIEFNLDSILEQLADTIGLQASAKGVEFLAHYDPIIPSPLLGDPLRLQQILFNLCSNALKFTERGEIEVFFRAIEQTDATFTIQVCVRDTGIGMAPDVQAKLFEKFTQADQSTTRRFGGTGLGLAICKSLVEAMGGRIWIEQSVPNQGSTFCFTMPLGVLESARERQHELETTVRPLLQGVRMLAVDDNQASLEVLAGTLRPFGIVTLTASSGAEALELLVANCRNGTPVDLVLMDWRMPGMNGDEATLSIRRDPAIRPQPKVVLFTAYHRDDIFRQANAAGINACLVKPATPSTLVETLLSVLGRGRVLPKSGAPIGDHAHDFSDLRILLVEDNDINREFAGELLRGKGIEVDEAVNGSEAVARVQEKVYDAVLMDIQMPVMDGLEATRQIRALGKTLGRERLRDMPIIAMTALAMGSDVKKSVAAGMNDHITKPVEPERLMDALAKCVLRWEQPVTTNEVAFDVPADLLAMKSLDARNGIRHIGGKPDAYRKQLTRFRERYVDAAAELERLMHEAGLEEAEHYCHALKGVAGNIGAQALYEQVTALDNQLKQNLAPAPNELREMTMLLKAAIADIDHLNVAATTPAVPGKSLGSDELRELIEQLAHALEHDLGAAESLIERLRPELRGTPAEAVLVDIEKQIDTFDTDAALQLVHRMRKEMSSQI